MRAYTAFLICVMFATSGAVAQQYPERPVRIIVPWPAGGIADMQARLVASILRSRLGQEFVVDNQPGALGALGTAIAARAAPDGYTLVLGDNRTHSMLSVMCGSRLGYDPVRDFAPIAAITRSPSALVVRPVNAPASLNELLTELRRNRSQLQIASQAPGTTEHAMASLFAQATGVQPQANANTSGSAQRLTQDGSVAFVSATEALSATRAGTARVLAVSGTIRVNGIDAPTLREAGARGFDVTDWYGIYAPTGTPANVLARLNAEINTAMNSPELTLRLSAEGARSLVGGPAGDLANLAMADIVHWRNPEPLMPGTGAPPPPPPPRRIRTVLGDCPL